MTTKSRRRKTKPVTVTKPVDVGVFEIVFGLMILIPKYRYWGSIGLILLLVAVFPANIYLAQSTQAQEAIGATQDIASWRLPVQGIFIWIAYWIRK